MAAPTKVSIHPSRHVYDVIVVGGQLGGAVAAALLAKQGHRVLLVEHDGLGQGYEHGGYLLPYAPFLAPPLRSLPAMDEVLTELGLNTAAGRALRPHVPELQLVLPEHRLDLPADEPRRLQELQREFGDRAAAINDSLKSLQAFHERSDAFFREPQLELPPDGFMESWGLKKLVKRHPALATDLPPRSDDPAVRLLEKLAPFLSYQAQPTRPVARGRTLSQVLGGPSRYPGGREGLRELLNKKLADLGGDVLLAGDAGEHFIVEQLVFEGDRAVGVKLLQGEQVYRASALVAATDAGALRRLIAEKKKHRKLTEALDLSTTKHILFTVNWVLRESALPRGMGELVLYSTGDDLDPLLLQQHPARKVGGKEEDGVRVVSASAFVPSTARDLGEAHLRSIADRIGAHLEALMPFARAHLLLASAPYLDAGGVRGSRLLPHPLFGVEGEPLVGVEGLNQRTPVKNFFLASREVLPGLGLEGEFIAGRRAARLVAAVTKKKAPL
jgi:phytoene dehydrogenase-like protein